MLVTSEEHEREREREQERERERERERTLLAVDTDCSKRVASTITLIKYTIST